MTLARASLEESARQPRWTGSRAARHTAATGIFVGIAMTLFYLAPEITAQPAGHYTPKCSVPGLKFVPRLFRN